MSYVLFPKLSYATPSFLSLFYIKVLPGERWFLFVCSVTVNTAIGDVRRLVTLRMETPFLSVSLSL